ncbi:MAG TPA: TadE/TadG family type IV pilus assembly protein [Nocardioides sp.]|nr:TadE/TadG family type IV pilus assembly protein [Nocardioides sp.]
MGTTRARNGRDEGGAAAVEFALIVPLLCFLLFAIIAYGYMLSFRQAVSQAAAEGARAAAVAPRTLDAASVKTRAVQAVNQGLDAYGVTCLADGKLMHDGEQAGTCTISGKQACSGSTVAAQCVEVALSYTYEDDSLLPTFPGLGVLLPETLSYTTEAQVS